MVRKKVFAISDPLEFTTNSLNSEIDPLENHSARPKVARFSHVRPKVLGEKETSLTSLKRSLTKEGHSSLQKQNASKNKIESQILPENEENKVKVRLISDFNTRREFELAAKVFAKWLHFVARKKRRREKKLRKEQRELKRQAKREKKQNSESGSNFCEISQTETCEDFINQKSKLSLKLNSSNNDAYENISSSRCEENSDNFFETGRNLIELERISSSAKRIFSEKNCLSNSHSPNMSEIEQKAIDVCEAVNKHDNIVQNTPRDDAGSFRESISTDKTDQRPSKVKKSKTGKKLEENEKVENMISNFYLEFLKSEEASKRVELKSSQDLKVPYCNDSTLTTEVTRDLQKRADTVPCVASENLDSVAGSLVNQTDSTESARSKYKKHKKSKRRSSEKKQRRTKSSEDLRSCSSNRNHVESIGSKSSLTDRVYEDIMKPEKKASKASGLEEGPHMLKTVAETTTNVDKCYHLKSLVHEDDAAKKIAKSSLTSANNNDDSVSLENNAITLKEFEAFKIDSASGILQKFVEQKVDVESYEDETLVPRFSKASVLSDNALQVNNSVVFGDSHDFKTAHELLSADANKPSSFSFSKETTFNTPVNFSNCIKNRSKNWLIDRSDSGFNDMKPTVGQSKTPIFVFETTCDLDGIDMLPNYSELKGPCSSPVLGDFLCSYKYKFRDCSDVPNELINVWRSYLSKCRKIPNPALTKYMRGYAWCFVCGKLLVGFSALVSKWFLWDYCSLSFSSERCSQNAFLARFGSFPL